MSTEDKRSKELMAQGVLNAVLDRFSTENIIAVISSLLLVAITLVFNSVISKGNELKPMNMIFAAGIAVVWAYALMERRLNRKDRATIHDKSLREQERKSLLKQFTGMVGDQYKLDKPHDKLSYLVTLMDHALDDTPLGTKIADELLTRVETQTMDVQRLRAENKDIMEKLEELKIATENNSATPKTGVGD